MITHRRTRIAAAIVAAAVALASAGCASTAAEPELGQTQERVALNVGVRNLTAYSSALYWASAEGYFDEAGLDVSLVVGEAAHTSQLVAGQVDVYWGAQGGLFGITNSGKTVHTIYGADSGANAYVVSSNPDVRSPEECRTMTTATPGTVMYAWTRQLETIYDVQWELTQLTAIPAILANVTAQRTDCAVGNISYYQSGVDDGTLQVILDPGDAESLPDDWPELGVEAVAGGLPDVLADNRDAVERFLAAYTTALEDFRTAEPADIAQTLIAFDPGWAASGTPDVLATSIEQFDPFMSPDEGFISEETWDTTLAFYRDGGLDFLGTDPERFSYADAVDMSYLEAATTE